MTETQPPPQTNGLPDDGLEDEDRTKIRPADIDADVREMERRKRVEMIMNSRLFREELERIIEIQMKDGSGSASLLQSISDMMGLQGQRLQSAHLFRSSNCVAPINDIRGVESMGYAKGEKILRCKVAAVYRLMDLYGWTQNIQNHITARLNVDEEIFLVNPHGLLYNEITASSLVKVDMRGDVIEPGTTNFGVNTNTFALHAAIHASRPDLKAIVHVHTCAVLAVSSLKCGLLPLSRESVVLGEISTHPFTGYGKSGADEEKEKIVRNLGPNNKVMFLSNNGAVCCGETVEEAFYNVYNLVAACEAQLKLLPAGVDNLALIPEDVRKEIYDSSRVCPEGAIPASSNGPAPAVLEKKEKRWRIGGMEFEALMRMLDNAGFRTGYIYRTPLIKGDPPRPRNDVEVPPAVSSLGYLLEEEEMYRNGWKGRKSNDRTRWLNSPNVYQKVEILETGTSDPKKITKWVEASSDAEWVADGSPTHSSTPVKIDAALQFVPKNTNPKEFKKLQQQIKENRRADKITSGPQSQLLEGVSWEEAKKLQDANMSATGDQVILVGAASKGIIQRGFQHNATVYKTPYAKNPFDQMTDQEIEDYKSAISRKSRGGGDFSCDDMSESEGGLSSSAALSKPAAAHLPVSETDDESRDEPRVLRINNKQVPKASQPEVVLSDDHSTRVLPGVIDNRRPPGFVPSARSHSLSTPSLSFKSSLGSFYSTPSLYHEFNATPSTLSYHSQRFQETKLVQVKSSILPVLKKAIFVSVGKEGVAKNVSPDRVEVQNKPGNLIVRRRNSDIMKKKHHFLTARPVPVVTIRKSDSRTIKSILNNLLLFFQDVKYSQSLRFPSSLAGRQSPCSFVFPPDRCSYLQSAGKDTCTGARTENTNATEISRSSHVLTQSTQTLAQPFAKSNLHAHQLQSLESPYKRMFENVLGEMKDQKLNKLEPAQQIRAEDNTNHDVNKPAVIPKTPVMALVNLNSEFKELLIKSSRKLKFDSSPIDNDTSDLCSDDENNLPSTSTSIPVQSTSSLQCGLESSNAPPSSFLDELKSKLRSPNKGLIRSPDNSPMKKYSLAPEIQNYLNTKDHSPNNNTCDEEVSTSFMSPVSNSVNEFDISSLKKPLSLYIPPEHDFIVDSPPAMMLNCGNYSSNYLSPIYEVSAEESAISEKFVQKIEKYTYSHVHSSGSIDDISSVENTQLTQHIVSNNNITPQDITRTPENDLVLPNNPETEPSKPLETDNDVQFQAHDSSIDSPQTNTEDLTSEHMSDIIIIKQENEYYDDEEYSFEEKTMEHDFSIPGLQVKHESDLEGFDYFVASRDIDSKLDLATPISSIEKTTFHENEVVKVKIINNEKDLSIEEISKSKFVKQEEPIDIINCNEECCHEENNNKLELTTKKLEKISQSCKRVKSPDKKTIKKMTYANFESSNVVVKYTKFNHHDKCPSFINLELPQSSKKSNKLDRTPRNTPIRAQNQNLSGKGRGGYQKDSKSCQQPKVNKEFKHGQKLNRSLDSLPCEVSPVSTHNNASKANQTSTLPNQTCKLKRSCFSQERSSTKENSQVSRAKSCSPSPSKVKSPLTSRRNLFDSKISSVGKKFERQCCKKKQSEDITLKTSIILENKLKKEKITNPKSIKQKSKSHSPKNPSSTVDYLDLKPKTSCILISCIKNVLDNKTLKKDVKKIKEIEPEEKGIHNQGSEMENVLSSEIVDAHGANKEDHLLRFDTEVSVDKKYDVQDNEEFNYSDLKEDEFNSEKDVETNNYFDNTKTVSHGTVNNEKIENDGSEKFTAHNDKIVLMQNITEDTEKDTLDKENTNVKNDSPQSSLVDSLEDRQSHPKSSSQNVSDEPMQDTNLEKSKVMLDSLKDVDTNDTQYITLDVTGFSQSDSQDIYQENNIAHEEFDQEKNIAPDEFDQEKNIAPDEFDQEKNIAPDEFDQEKNIAPDESDQEKNITPDEFDQEKNIAPEEFADQSNSLKCLEDIQHIVLEGNIKTINEIFSTEIENVQSDSSTSSEEHHINSSDANSSNELVLMSELLNIHKANSEYIIDYTGFGSVTGEESTSENCNAEFVDIINRKSNESSISIVQSEEGTSESIKENVESCSENEVQETQWDVESFEQNTDYLENNNQDEFYLNDDTSVDPEYVTLDRTGLIDILNNVINLNLNQSEELDNANTKNDDEIDILEQKLLTPRNQKNTHHEEFPDDFESTRSSYVTCQDESFSNTSVTITSPYQLCFFTKKDKRSLGMKSDTDITKTQTVDSTHLDRSLSTSGLKISFDNHLSSIHGDFQSASSSSYMKNTMDSMENNQIDDNMFKTYDLNDTKYSQVSPDKIIDKKEDESNVEDSVKQELLENYEFEFLEAMFDEDMKLKEVGKKSLEIWSEVRENLFEHKLKAQKRSHEILEPTGKVEWEHNIVGNVEHYDPLEVMCEELEPNIQPVEALNEEILEHVVEGSQDVSNMEMLASEPDFDSMFEFGECDLEGNNLSSILFEHIVSMKSSPHSGDLLRSTCTDNMYEQIDSVASMQFENESCEREFNQMIENEFVSYISLYLKRSFDSLVEHLGVPFHFSMVPDSRRQTI